MSISEHIVRVTRAGGEATAIDFRGRTVDWSTLGKTIVALRQLLTQMGIDPGSSIGLLGRNRLEPLTAFISVLGAGYGLLLVNAIRPRTMIAAELRELRLACVLGDQEDLSAAVLAAAEEVGTLALEVKVDAEGVELIPRTSIGSGPFRVRPEGALIEIQTSGTTGAPKRIAVAERTIAASLKDGVRTATGAVEQSDLLPKSSPTLMFGPLVHTSGTFNTLMSVFEVRPIVLIEKFEVDEFLQLLRTWKPKFIPLPPPAIKMLMESNATAVDFEGVRAVRAGTAPLSVDLQRDFESRFGVPVLVTYGATEFMGVVTSWTLDDHRRFADSKRGSVGRPSAGVEIRIIDQNTGDVLGPSAPGVLEARLQRIDGGKTWIRTTDLARLDEDGFLFIMGRLDDAIIRGGFKIMGGRVAEVLRTLPGVAEAVVVGRSDERLGEVPVAVIEPTTSNTGLDEAGLRAMLKERLNPYEVPARFHFVERLPRTVSDKVSLVEVKNLLRTLEGDPA